jgi:hypothetical protein
MEELITELWDAVRAAAWLRCHPRTLLRKARAGLVPSFHVFGRVRFTQASLSDWLTSQGFNPPADLAA